MKVDALIVTLRFAVLEKNLGVFMHVFCFRRILIVLLACSLAACSDSPLEKAEKSLIEVHRELKSRSSQRDSTEAGIQHSLSKLSEYRRQSAIAEFHEVAKNGDAGTSEQLIVARKMLDDPSYERKLNASYSDSKRDAADALEHIKWLQDGLPQARARVREYLPIAKTALAEYENALGAEALRRGKRPSTSYDTDAAVREIKKELDLDVRRAYLEKPETERQDGLKK